VTGVTLNKTSLSLTVGGSETLTADVRPADAANRAVTWNTSDGAVAGVANGKVTAVKAGTATITVTTADGGKQASCTVTVADALTQATDLAKFTIPAMTVGAKIADIDLAGIVTGGKTPYTYTATGLPAGLTLSGSKIAGTPTVGAAGSAKITVKDSSTPAQSKELTISFGAVVPAPPAHVAVTGISGVPDAATAGTPLTLTGTVAPSNATNKTIAWSVKSAGTTGATISGGGFYATSAGTATITATVASGTSATTAYTQDFTITVNLRNSLLTSLDVSYCTALTGLDCTGNALASIDITGCTALEYIHADGNRLDASALRAILAALPDRTGGEAGRLNCEDNPGWPSITAREVDAAENDKNWWINYIG
jgi:uncharacterized protein YjdB